MNKHEQVAADCLAIRNKIDGNNDCSVFALSVATKMSYLDAYYILAHYGRRKNCGMRHFAATLLTINLPNIKFSLINGLKKYNIHSGKYNYTTIESFLKTYKEGTFIITIKRHAFVIVDGIVYDWCFSDHKERIYEAIKVTTLAAEI